MLRKLQTLQPLLCDFQRDAAHAQPREGGMGRRKNASATTLPALHGTVPAEIFPLSFGHPPLKQVLRGAKNTLSPRPFLTGHMHPKRARSRFFSRFLFPQKTFASSPLPHGRRTELPRSAPPSEQEEKTSFCLSPLPGGKGGYRENGRKC